MNQQEVGGLPVSLFCAGRSPVSSDPKSSANHRFPFYMGIELELENVRAARVSEKSAAPLLHWTTHVDESLRNGTEYVTEMPLAGGDIVAAVDSFFAQNYRYTGGPRTSTHVHVNACDLKVGNIQTMFAISYVVEDALFRVIEAKRKWCGYCMPLTEMGPPRIRLLMAAQKDHEISQFMGGHNADKYYGFNVNSIRRHGTVEFRYFPGAPTKSELLDWMDYCTSIKRIGLKYTLAQLGEFQEHTQFAAFLEAELGQWGRRIVRAVDTQSLFELLQEVLALSSQDDGPNRRDELVFITKPLLKYINNRFCVSGAQRSWLLPRLQKFQVTTLDEYASLMEESRLHAKEPKQQARVDMEQFVPSPAWAANVVEEAPQPGRMRVNPFDADAVRDYMQRHAAEMERLQQREQQRAVPRPARPLPPRG